MLPKIASSLWAEPTVQVRKPTERLSLRSYQDCSRAANLRAGSILMVVLVVLMIAGMLSYQSMRTLLMVRKSHSQQAQVAQARELLDLARQLEQSQSQRELIQPGRYAVVLQVGDQFGKLELVYAIQAVQGGQREADAQTMWIAKLPVDSQGNEITGQSTVVVSSER